MFESEQNAIVILKKDHKKVKELFDEFEATDARQQKVRIASTVIKELKAHSIVEEEIFYPAVREDVGGKVMNEAVEEHHVAKLLIAELEKMTGAEDHFDAKFKVLAESIRHHIKEEESNMLPNAESADIDFDALGEELLARKEELLKKGFPVLKEEKLIGPGRGKHLDSGKRARAAKSKKSRHSAVYSKNNHVHSERSGV
jgi:hemerythrin superfamily protein